jgi:hypothetical protein
MTFYPFADTMGVDSRNVPADPRYFRLVALYVTGGIQMIEATAAEIARFREGGVGVINIDQTQALATWRAGLGDVADVEQGAGTYADAAAGAKARQEHGWESTIYLSRDAIDAQTQALRDAGADLAMVKFGVADWSLSQAEAEQALDANPSWAYVQWASPSSNPLTVLSGTGEDLRVTNVDLNIAGSWAEAFLPKPPASPSTPAKTGTGYRQVADGTRSLVQVATQRGATVLGLLEISAQNLDAKNAAAMNAYLTGPGPGVREPMPKGLVYYTEHP